MNKRQITEHEKEAYRDARKLFYRKEIWEPVNAKEIDTLTCWIYMRMCYYGYKTMYDGTEIPQTIEELEEWEKNH